MPDYVLPVLGIRATSTTQGGIIHARMVDANDADIVLGGGGGGSGGAVTVADGANVAQGTTTDAATASTVIGRLKAIANALAGILSVKIDQTTPGTTNAVQVTGALPAGTSLIGKVGIDQTTPGTTNGVSSVAQKSATDTLQNGATANGNGTVSTTDGYESLQVLITNGAGTATLTIQGSLDSSFAVAQDSMTMGMVKLSDSAAGVNTARSVVSGVIAVAANTSYLYSIYDVLPNVRAVISAASGLAAGTTDTGLTVKIYKLAV